MRELEQRVASLEDPPAPITASLVPQDAGDIMLRLRNKDLDTTAVAVDVRVVARNNAPMDAVHITQESSFDLRPGEAHELAWTLADDEVEVWTLSVSWTEEGRDLRQERVPVWVPRS